MFRSVFFLLLWSSLLTPNGALAAQSGREWFEGEAVRFMLPPRSENPRLDSVLLPIRKNLVGAWIGYEGERVDVELVFTRPFLIAFEHEKKKNRQIYGIQIPMRTRFQIQVQNGVIRMDRFSRGGDALKFWVRLPFFSDAVLVKKLELDGVTGIARAELMVMGGRIPIQISGDLLSASSHEADTQELKH